MLTTLSFENTSKIDKVSQNFRTLSVVKTYPASIKVILNILKQIITFINTQIIRNTVQPMQKLFISTKFFTVYKIPFLITCNASFAFSFRNTKFRKIFFGLFKVLRKNFLFFFDAGNFWKSLSVLVKSWYLGENFLFYFLFSTSVIFASSKILSFNFERLYSLNYYLLPRLFNILKNFDYQRS